MSSMSARDDAPLKGDPGSALPVPDGSDLFVRQATGLVRTVTGRQSIALNFIAGPTTLAVAIGLFFALAGFPGGNYLVAILFALPFALAFAYSFGLLSAMMPRSGGDYMVVGRILSPVAGLVSTSCMMVAQLLSIAGAAYFTVTLAVTPSLTTIGLVSGDTTFSNWANTLTTSKGWQYALSALIVLLLGGIMSMGWSWAKRFIFWGLAFSLGGLLVATAIELFTSRAGFESHFNSFAAPILGQRHAYQDVLATARKAGTPLNSSFSLSQSFAMMGVMAGYAIYSWNTAFIAGEVRQGSSLKTAHRMGLGAVFSLATVALVTAVFFKTFGRPFLTAVFGGALPAKLGTTGAYFFLTSVQVHSTLFAVLLCASFVVALPVVAGVIILVMSRVIFAWAFDGILPQGVTKVTSRNAPIFGIWLLVLASLGVLAWAVYGSSGFVQIVVYTTLIQLMAMALVGVAAMVVPYRRPELYRSSSSTATIGRIPIVSIAGLGAVVGTGIIWYLDFHYKYYGLANKGKFFIWVAGTIAAGLAFYGIARAVRARQGVDLRLVYEEIPPE